jgi:hypothetical protein
MFEGLEKIGAQYKRTSWDKAFLVFNLVFLAFLIFGLVFESDKILYPGHRVWHLAFILGSIAISLGTILNSRRMKRRQSN